MITMITSTILTKVLVVIFQLIHYFLTVAMTREIYITTPIDSVGLMKAMTSLITKTWLWQP